MKVDIGFWDSQGMYIPDVQEVDEMEIGKEITNADGSRNWEANILLDNVKRLEQENADLKKYIERMDKPVVEVVDADIALENAELKEKNAALEETLQTIEQLKDEDSLRIAQLVTENAKLKNERTADLVKQIDELKEENERLNRCMMEALHHEGNALRETIKYKQTLQEIKAIAEFHITDADSEDVQNDMKQILDLITKAED